QSHSCFQWGEDEPFDVESDSEEFTGGETEAEMMGGKAGGMVKEDDSDSEWHDTQDILRAERVEASTEK
ncbi:hypothetical protein KI387_027135, partial [Taxus chinensis]